MIISAQRLVDKATGNKPIGNRIKSFARTAGALIPLAFLLNSSGVVLFGASPTGSVTITGTAEVGQTLTASNNLADADGIGTITYQWYRDGKPIYGGTDQERGRRSGRLGWCLECDPVLGRKSRLCHGGWTMR